MDPDEYRKPKKKLDDFIRYSNLAFEMLAIMAVGTFSGILIDDWLDWGFPAFTLVLMVLSVVGAIYHVVRKFI
jgi:F0F1-type ATP synthase assembly protein I